MDKEFNNIFNNTTNSYKYYWWLSIIEICTKDDKSEITFEELTFKILSKIWYPVNYFKLSFGKQDQYSKFVKEIQEEYNLEDNIKDTDLYNFLIENRGSKSLVKINKQLTKYVPYRFIRPWYSNELRRLKDSLVNDKIIEVQDERSPYEISELTNSIILNPQWVFWIRNNYTLIHSFTMFKLLKYLERNNPLVTNLSKKLQHPEKRNLIKPTKLWKRFIDKNGTKNDIFENQPLKSIQQLSIDHFLPWSYTGHDLIWNLHPVESTINSSKNNKIPELSYFPRFYDLQYCFLNFLILDKSDDSNKAQEDYIMLLNCSYTDLKVLSNNKFIEMLRNKMIPQYEIARNMGFESGWSIE